MGRGGACVLARVAPQGRIHRSSPCAMRVFLVWKRRYADVRAGTQAPPLRFRLGRLCVEWLVSFGEWIVHGLRVSFGWVMRANALNPRGRMVWGDQACRACTFDSPGLATIGAYPG